MSTTGPRHVLAAQRKQQVVELRQSGHSIRAIGKSVGISGARVYKILKEQLGNLAKVTTQAAEELRGRELADLDALEDVMMEAALDGDCKSAAVVLRIKERRARLVGLDAPTTSRTWADLNMVGDLAGMTDEQLLEQARRMGLDVSRFRCVPDGHESNGTAAPAGG